MKTMKKGVLIGKMFRVYQGEKLEGIAKVEHVEILYSNDNEAYCRVRFIEEPAVSYYRWIKFENREDAR